MQIPFYKYHGTGNDFIIIDHRSQTYIDLYNTDIVENLCHRRFGIGADGLILLENSKIADFKMVYFNADGRQSTMCGNGGRCIVHFAHFLSIFDKETKFEAIDGIHHAHITDTGMISLGMNDVVDMQKLNDNIFILDTGSPHFVKFLDTMPDNIRDSGSSIRYSEAYRTNGINVNFVVRTSNELQICTYERGVEDETYSCGTGVVAAAISSLANKPSGNYHVPISTKGGKLEVVLTKSCESNFHDVRLIGPAVQVFSGSIKV